MLNEVKSRFAGKRSISYLLSLSVIALFLLAATGCNQEGAIVDPAQNQNLNVALQKVTDNDESIKSFKPNYNEEQAMSFLGVLGKEIFPLRVGQALKLVDRNLTIQYDTETALGTLVEKFDGVLIISGSFKQPDSTNKRAPADTVIRKQFSTVITRLIKYTKVSNTGDNLVDWKVAGVSLPAGGTETDNIQISKLTLATQDGKTLEITNPNEFFFDRGFMNGYGMGSNGNGGMGGGMGNNGSGGMGGGMGSNGNGGMGSGMGSNGNGNGMGSGMLSNGTRGMSAMFGSRQPIKITVEIISKYEAEDFLTLTHGAMMSSNSGRVKEKFELKSSVKEGSNYKKTYEKVWLTNAHGGFMHVVVNAVPKQVVFETSTQVEEKTWGFPYQIK